MSNIGAETLCQTEPGLRAECAVFLDRRNRTFPKNSHVHSLMPPSEPASRSSFAADSLANGMMLMLALTIIQRALGFFRGIWFCRMMDDTAVGQWAMAFGFMLLITPVMMLGLSGAMPRFVERYRLAGQLPAFVRRVAIGTCLGAAGVLFVMYERPEWCGWLVFRSATENELIYALALAVLSMLVFNFVIDLVSSLRQVRVNSIMQFVQGVGFTVLALLALHWGGNVISLLHSFTLASLLGTLPGIWVLLRGWGGLPTTGDAFDSRAMWRSLLPYALALWVINLLTNLFEMSDRYMILHYMPIAGTLQTADEIGQAAVGQYHSGRLIPTLLCNIAAMFAGILMPYLAADWETGNRPAANQNLRRSVMLAAGLFTFGSAVALLFAPWTFNTLLEGRYSDGLRLMPQAFVICIWMSLISLCQLHIWLNEKGRWFGYVLAVGILINIALNRLWLPVYGLDGAVWGTVVSTGVVLVGLLWQMHRLNFTLERDFLLVMLLPLALLLPPVTAVIASALVLYALPNLRRMLIEAAVYLLAQCTPAAWNGKLKLQQGDSQL